MQRSRYARLGRCPTTAADLINQVALKADKKISVLIRRQLQQWIATLTSYIKPCFMLRKLS
ncbi:hypothetical protein QYF57_16590 [Paenibacillus polymyxa]|nr:hypothetical protein [Paenibacillus polymyxa]MDN4115199.1 hypothetical protein [Paenibacillus polymyxa]